MNHEYLTISKGQRPPRAYRFHRWCLTWSRSQLIFTVVLVTLALALALLATYRLTQAQAIIELYEKIVTRP